MLPGFEERLLYPRFTLLVAMAASFFIRATRVSLQAQPVRVIRSYRRR